MLALIWFVFAQMWRWCYAGRVCAGDYLSKEKRQEIREDNDDPDSKIYLIAEGNFLEGVIIAIYCMFGILLIVVIVVALFCSQ